MEKRRNVFVHTALPYYAGRPPLQAVTEQEAAQLAPALEGADAAAAGLAFREFRLRDAAYFLKGQPIPGFLGMLTVENSLSGFHRELANALLVFSGFSDIGIKTTLGMGGVRHKIQ